MIETPGSPEELAEQLAGANARNRAINLCGASSKILMAGPVSTADLNISIAKMHRLLQYEPRDLTISVEAGMPFRELTRILAEHGQMVPLDPGFSEDATVGGVVAANVSGPRRRLYGTARDMVIGMTFATLEGKLVRTGGMVVKNVAGLDMGKLMIGSFGTLAALAIVNFRLHPTAHATRTFIQEFETVADAILARDAVLKSTLQPPAIDIVKADSGYRLTIQAGGSPGVLDRYSRELDGARVVDGADEAQIWRNIRELTPDFLREHPLGAVVRISCKLSDVGSILESLPAPALARAGSGVCYGYFPNAGEIPPGLGVVEFAPQQFRETQPLWPSPGTDFEMMKKIKHMFDPRNLLNRGRLYGRI